MNILMLRDEKKGLATFKRIKFVKIVALYHNVENFSQMFRRLSSPSTDLEQR